MQILACPGHAPRVCMNSFRTGSAVFTEPCFLTNLDPFRLVVFHHLSHRAYWAWAGGMDLMGSFHLELNVPFSSLPAHCSTMRLYICSYLMQE